MRNYIFGFKQDFLKEKKINLKQTLILNYINEFSKSSDIKTEIFDGKKFYWISTQKLLSDLPVLNIEKRQYERLLSDLEKKQMLDRKVDDNHIYLNISKFFFFKS